ncbi:MAG: protoheme IX farnesyltransferase [Bdellovibrionales bacterium]|nr:protoheme IX farnesyltransferase [Bdellovibrionales bacterium]
MKSYWDLTKTGIVVFVIISALAGYFIALPMGMPVDPLQLGQFILGIYLLSAGSFALNQAQEWRRDSVMERTKDRPIPLGKMMPWQAWTLGLLFVFSGLTIIYLLSPLAAKLGLCTVFLYNGLYTLFWKRRWAFGAVPGALPGAMPAVIGYSVNSSDVLVPTCIYMFLILFLWQMPHFWCLAIRYKDDYRAGGFPVLSSAFGVEATLYHIGLYVFAYVGVALVSPWFLKTHMLYVLLVLPISLKVLWEFFRYHRQEGKEGWLRFFLWVNFSMLIFIWAPVADRWLNAVVINS